MISSVIRCDKEFTDSLERLCAQMSAPEPLPIVVNGLTDGAALAYSAELVHELYGRYGRPVLILVRDEEERERVLRGLCDSGVSAVGFRSRDFVFHNVSASHDNERERLSVLRAVLDGSPEAVVTTPYAASIYTLPAERLEASSVTLSVGAELSPRRLCEVLSSSGFVRVELVESAGQFAARGGIVDFYSDASLGAVRVEFFGDEIDRIAEFDVKTQRAIRSLDRFELLPAVEVFTDGAAKARVVAEIKRLISLSREEAASATLARELAALESDRSLDARDKYIPFIYEKSENLFTYLHRGGRYPVIVLATAACEQSLSKRTGELSDTLATMKERGLLSADAASYAAGAEAYRAALSELAVAHVNSFSGSSGLGELAGIFGFRCRRTVAYGDNPTMLTEDLKSLTASGYRVILECESEQGASNLVSSLSDEGFAPALSLGAINVQALSRGSVTVTVGDGEGFELLAPKIAVMSMRRDEGRAVMAHKRRQRMWRKIGGRESAQRIMSHTDLREGDYVVHASYGIGLFEGIRTERVDGACRDYISIRYAGTDKLLVPCDKLDMLGKYIGARESDGTVKLSKMGGSEWTRAKNRAKSAARDIAKSLIELYAKRQRTPGFSFPEDSELEDQFASEFEYEETDSQLQAIEEIKRDMIRSVPMNRLLLGDVGFGKTEVALRAAFKAVMGGKQVAFLVPTTILALQHYQTALSRMRGYPVTVEMISRFKTAREQASILERLSAGKIDILIGTHKLLSKNVRFRDLGLLIVDEEQRFGVSQKEKLKALAANVDVLTLSATPIPRTLNMAMNGISDMSVLDEAPDERRPPQTYVLEHDDMIITDAMRRELARGGQVLYLYNKVDTIAYKADLIMRAIPEARVAYAHGQMDKDELEDIWQMLVAGEIDILVCTTIIETGVDLPAANTLVIENADRMGLSQLHQIRGRVGRSRRQAYAYFTYRPGKALSEIAEKRLRAIKEYAEFGAGFNIALRDLEIRGAGNLLGAEQHGYIDSVGYDLYVRLLAEAVLEERGEMPERPSECVIDIKVDAHIPEYYVTSSSGRMEMYKKISLIRSAEDFDDIFDEITDRYGDMPRSVERLLRVALCRAVGEEAKITRISHKQGRLLFTSQKPDIEVWAEIFEKHKGRLVGLQDGAICYRLAAGEDVTNALYSIMRDYYYILKGN